MPHFQGIEGAKYGVIGRCDWAECHDEYQGGLPDAWVWYDPISGVEFRRIADGDDSHPPRSRSLLLCPEHAKSLLALLKPEAYWGKEEP